MPTVRKRGRRSRRTHGSGAVYQRKDGIWVGSLHLGYDDTGKRHRSVVYGRTEKIAEDKLQDLREKQRKGLKLEGSKETVGALLTNWLERSKAMHQSTWHFRRDKIEMIRKTHIWKLPLRKLTREDVKDAINVDLIGLDRVPSWQSRKHAKDVLRAALFDAVDSQRIAVNPASKIEVTGGHRVDPQSLNLEQLEAFLSEAKKTEYYGLFVLAAIAGLRQGELLGLRKTDVSVKSGTIRVAQQLVRARGVKRKNGSSRPDAGTNLKLVRPKTAGSSRTFKLPARCVAALSAHLISEPKRRDKVASSGRAWNPDGLVFPSPEGGRLEPSRLVRDYFHPAITNANLVYSTKNREGFKFHSLRHTACTLMLLQGVPHKVIMMRMGWTTLAMVDRYAHLLPAMDDQAASAVDKLFA